jgi:hypothetical protein
MALLSERDSLRWHSVGEEVAGSLEPRLLPGVLANRSMAAASGSRLGRSLDRARREIRRVRARSEAVLLTDVRSFYPSVTPRVAFEAVSGVGLQDAASRIAWMLEEWGSEGYSGLPIGPPASAIVANAVLTPIDAELASSPCLRWVDDLAIGVDRSRRVPELLERLDLALDRLGLERAESKTHVHARGEPFGWLGTYGRPRGRSC